MRESARFKSALEVIENYDYPLGPLDQFLQNYFKARRFMGSSDRRFLSDHVYDYFKKLPGLKKLTDQVSLQTPQEFFLSYLIIFAKIELDQVPALFQGEAYGLPVLTARDQEIIEALKGVSSDSLSPKDFFPDWILQGAKFEDDDGECAAFMQQASLDVRLNSHKISRENLIEKLKTLGVEAEVCPLSPLGLRLQPRQKIQHWDLFKQGLLEIQDEGSQLIGLLCEAKPGMAILDYCAGAGGKTLLLNYLMQGQGRLVASDISAARLEFLKRRMGQNAAGIIEVIPQDQLNDNEKYDRVLCDAPCSGTGTMRRRPELKNFLTPDDVQQEILTQREILTKAKNFVKPGGQLIYGTCSVLNSENEEQAAWFLETSPDFKRVHLGQRWASMGVKKINMTGAYYKTTPAQHNTDGFFAAVFEKN